MSRTPSSRKTLLDAAGKATDDLLVRKALVPESVEPTADRCVRFTISTAAVDRDNDTIDCKGWDLKNYLKNPVVLWAHDYHSLPVGRATSVAITDGKLVSECQFADHPFAETVYQMVKQGFLRATSVGFRPSKYAVNEERRGLDFLEQELMEYSIVPVPANPEALVDMAGAKAAGIDTGPLIEWASKVVKANDAATPVPAPAPEPDEEKKPKPPAECDDAADESKKPPKPMPPEQCEEEKKPPSAPADEPEPDDNPDEEGDEEEGCKPPKKATCRICEQDLAPKMPRLRDDLGLVCARCWMKAAQPEPEPPPTVPPVVDATAAKKDTEAEVAVLDLDDDPREEVVVGLDEDDEAVVDLDPEEVRAALRSAVTSAVSTIVRDETRAAFNRARGRVD